MIALCIPAADFGTHTLIFVSENSTSSTLFALRAPAAVLADAVTAALLALLAPATVRADASTFGSVHAGW